MIYRKGTPNDIKGTKMREINIPTILNRFLDFTEIY